MGTSPNTNEEEEGNGEVEIEATYGDLRQQELVDLIDDRDKDKLSKLGGVEGVAKLLKSDVKDGISNAELTEEDLQRRIAAFGSNTFEYPPPKTLIQLMLEQLEDKTLQLLCFAAVISLVIGLAVTCHRQDYGYLEGIAIVLVVIVVTMVSSIIDYNKERKFRELNSVKDNYDVKCVRGGHVLGISVAEILVGDVIELTTGDKIPADALFVSSLCPVKTNESAMTGEPIDITKNSMKDPFFLSGTTVSEGSCFVLVVAVGTSSQWGVILKGLMAKPEETPLQERLEQLVVYVGIAGTVMALLTFTASMIRYVIDGAVHNEWEGGKPILDFVINAITIVVVAIPEGLPLAITLGLAFAMKKMMEDQNLVRRLEACETMGSATQLNADKTGTLTQNRMTVMEAFVGGRFFPKAPSKDELNDQFVDTLSQAISVNSTASLSYQADKVEHLGSKTECALISYVDTQLGKSYKELRGAIVPTRVYLFTSAKKRMSTVVPMANSKFRLYCKGASEIVLGLCDKIMNGETGKVSRISEDDRRKANESIDKMANGGLRTLCIAYVDLSKAPNPDKEDAPESQMTLLAIVGIKDPIRPETAGAVRLLRGAGVTVRMVTGDNATTARAIAKEAGILDEGGLVIEGPEFRKMSPEEQRKIATDILVLARSSPNDKLLLCRIQQELGEVVSVTGDGTNDAPALKEGDVGFALGIEGTEIAKEACDIIIMDDNIASMAKAVLWGRNVFFSIRKFLQFQLVVNIVAVTLNFIAACANVELPLRPVPLLWVNMIMDSMGALALATEPPSPSLMKQRPFGRTVPLINKEMWRNIIGVSIYQFLVCLVLLFDGKDLMDLHKEDFNGGHRGRRRLLSGSCDDESGDSTLKLNSVIFNTFVLMQVFSEINSRGIIERNVFKDIHKSGYFLFIIGITVATQALLMQAVGATTVGPAVGFVDIDGWQWLVCIILGIGILPVGFVTRLVPLDFIPIGVTDDEALANSKTGDTSTDDDTDVDTNGKGPKTEPPAPAAIEAPVASMKPSFKTVATSVMSANRFQAIIKERVDIRSRKVSAERRMSMEIPAEDEEKRDKIVAMAKTTAETERRLSVADLSKSE